MCGRCRCGPRRRSPGAGESVAGFGVRRVRSTFSGSNYDGAYAAASSQTASRRRRVSTSGDYVLRLTLRADGSSTLVRHDGKVATDSQLRTTGTAHCSPTRRQDLVGGCPDLHRQPACPWPLPPDGSLARLRRGRPGERQPLPLSATRFYASPPARREDPWPWNHLPRRGPCSAPLRSSSPLPSDGSPYGGLRIGCPSPRLRRIHGRSKPSPSSPRSIFLGGSPLRHPPGVV